MRGQCFNCGGNHWATACPKPVQGLEYKCPHCSNNLTISSRGQSVTAFPKAAANASAPLPSRMLAAPVQEEIASGAGKRKRSASPHSSVQAPAANAPRLTAVCNTGKVVSVCNKTYTSLSWFLGQDNPSPSLCTRARTQCFHNALELEGGDLRTLIAHGFAAQPPTKPKPLLPDRTSPCVGKPF